MGVRRASPESGADTPPACETKAARTLDPTAPKPAQKTLATIAAPPTTIVIPNGVVCASGAARQTHQADRQMKPYTSASGTVLDTARANGRGTALGTKTANKSPKSTHAVTYTASRVRLPRMGCMNHSSGWLRIS